MAREAATPRNNRFHRIFEQLEAAGIQAEPAVYAEDFADAVRAQLLAADGVLFRNHFAQCSPCGPIWKQAI